MNHISTYDKIAYHKKGAYGKRYCPIGPGRGCKRLISKITC